MVYALVKKKIKELEVQLAETQNKLKSVEERLLAIESHDNDEKIEDSSSILSNWANSHR